MIRTTSAIGRIGIGRTTPAFRQPEVRSEHLTLDGDGVAHFEVRDVPSFRYGGTLLAVMSYPDANGQFRTELNRFPPGTGGSPTMGSAG